MRLYFARHGESFNNQHEGRGDYHTQRKADPEITDRGRRQATLLAALLSGQGRSNAPGHGVVAERDPWNHAGFDITHVYTSLHRRAVETARIVSEALHLDPTAWPEIHESGGVVEYDPGNDSYRGGGGATHADLLQWAPAIRIDPAICDAIPSAGWWQGRPLETHEETALRADHVYQTLLERHGATDDRVLLVSHATFYVFFMCRVLSVPFSNELWFTLNNAGVTRIDIGDGTNFEPGIDARWRELPGLPVRIAYTNRLDHVPPALVS